MAKEMIAMILAGGQGSRLYALTQKLAKPAVPFGGKYRIIDFPLSNCVNSDIDTVGILTQYQPLVLNEYIGNGQPWGLNSSHGGVQVLHNETAWFWIDGEKVAVTGYELPWEYECLGDGNSAMTQEQYHAIVSLIEWQPEARIRIH